MTMSSCTLYKINDDADINLAQIKESISEKSYVDERYGLELSTIINVQNVNSNELWGTALYEKPYRATHLEGNQIVSKYQKRVIQSNFVFFIGSSLHFLSFSGLDVSEIIGAKLNKIILETLELNDVILNCDFPHTFIETFLTTNPHIPRWCDWKELNIPGTTTSSLGGSTINIAPDYIRYNQHGIKKSIRITLNENDWTIQLYDCGSIKFFNDVDEQEKLNFIKGKILPLL